MRPALRGGAAALLVAAAVLAAATLPRSAPRVPESKGAPALPPAPAPVPAPARPEAQDPRAALEAARRLTWAGDLEGARARYRAALATDPATPAFFEDLLVAHVLRDPTPAVAAAARARARDPDPLAAACVALGLAAGMGFEGDPPWDELRARLSAHPSGPLVDLVHAFDLAEEDCSQLLAPFADRRHALLRELVEGVSRARPDSGLAAVARARAAWHLGRREEALVELARPLALEGAGLSARERVRGAVLAELGREDEAARALTLAVIEPFATEARFERARLAARRGPAGVVAVYERNDPGLVAAKLLLARALLARGERDAARRQLDEAVALTERGGDALGRFRAAGRSVEDQRLVAALNRTGVDAPGAAEARGLRARVALATGEAEVVQGDLRALSGDVPLEEGEASWDTLATLKGERDRERLSVEAALARSRGQGADAVRLFGEALRAGQGALSPDAHLAHALVLETAGERAAAIAACASASHDPLVAEEAAALRARLRAP